MENVSTSNYIQIPLEKNIIDAIEYIISNKQSLGIKTQKQIIMSLGLIEANYISARNKKRGLPKDIIDNIRTVLIRDYNVNKDFIDKKQLPIIKNFQNVVNEMPMYYGNPQIVLELRKEIEILKEKLESKDEIINLQKNQMLYKKLSENARLFAEKRYSDVNIASIINTYI